MAAANNHRIVLAHVTAAQGIRGDLTLKTYLEDPHDLASYGPLTDERGERQFKITSLRVTTRGVVAHLKGVDDRSAAEALRGTGLYVDRSALPAAADGSYYHVDLVGLAAVDAQGTDVGKIIAIVNFGAGPLLELRRAGARDTEYVPFTDTYVPEVDIAGGRLTVIMPVMVGDPEPASEDQNDDA